MPPQFQLGKTLVFLRAQSSPQAGLGGMGWGWDEFAY